MRLWILAALVIVSFGSALAVMNWLGSGEPEFDRTAKADLLAPVGLPPAKSTAEARSDRVPDAPADGIRLSLQRGPAPSPAPSPVVQVITTSSSALDSFFAALAELEAGKRTRPVTVLQLGGAHATADRLAVEVRQLLQSRFGDAGQGPLLAPGSIANLRVKGARLDVTGAWRPGGLGSGPTGLAGVHATASAAGAEFRITADAPFDWAEVTFLSGPGGGGATMAVDGRSGRVATRAGEARLQRARIEGAGSMLTITAVGDGPVTVVGWELGAARRGVRYASLARPGARISDITRADELLVADELTYLAPDLVVLAYGAEEALDDATDATRLTRDAAAAMMRIKSLRPKAAILVVGPPDIARLPDFASREARQSTSLGCRALTDAERTSYDRLTLNADERLVRWHAPRRLDEVRAALAKAAAEAGAHFWDWSRAMGGACTIHAWAHAKPPLAQPDRFTLTPEGLQRSGQLLFSELIQGYSADRSLAQRRQ